VTDLDIDPHMLALAQRAYEAYAEELTRLDGCHTVRWDVLEGKEKIAWVVAARSAGQNFPAPIVIEIKVKLPDNGLAITEPTVLKFWCQDDAKGVEDLVKCFRDALKELISPHE